MEEGEKEEEVVGVKMTTVGCSQDDVKTMTDDRGEDEGVCQTFRLSFYDEDQNSDD